MDINYNDDVDVKDVLKLDGEDVRLCYGDKWLVWYKNEWAVFQQKSYQKETRTITITQSFDLAVKKLIENEK